MSNAWERETDKRIEAIEDNLSPSLWKRISELEASSASHTEKLESIINDYETLIIPDNTKEIAELKKKIDELNEKLGKTELVEEIYNKVIDGSLFSQIPVIKEMKDEIFKYKMSLKKEKKKNE